MPVTEVPLGPVASDLMGEHCEMMCCVAVTRPCGFKLSIVIEGRVHSIAFHQCTWRRATTQDM